MLKAAKKRTTEFANVDLRRGDLEALPIDDDLCDAALLLLALTYVADAPKVVAEILKDVARHRAEVKPGPPQK